MNREDTIHKLKAMQYDLHTLREVTDSPAIEACAREMLLQCYLALAYLGVVDSAFPELLD